MAWLKRLICANGFGFITLGFFMNLLHIWSQILNEPGTNMAALINLSILGIVQAVLFKRWQRNYTYKEYKLTPVKGHPA
jgi:hypothetical protein